MGVQPPDRLLAALDHLSGFRQATGECAVDGASEEATFLEGECVAFARIEIRGHQIRKPKVAFDLESRLHIGFAQPDVGPHPITGSKDHPLCVCASARDRAQCIRRALGRVEYELAEKHILSGFHSKRFPLTRLRRWLESDYGLEKPQKLLDAAGPLIHGFEPSFITESQGDQVRRSLGPKNVVQDGPMPSRLQGVEEGDVRLSLAEQARDLVRLFGHGLPSERLQLLVLGVAERCSRHGVDLERITHSLVLVHPSASRNINEQATVPFAWILGFVDQAICFIRPPARTKHGFRG